MLPGLMTVSWEQLLALVWLTKTPLVQRSDHKWPYETTALSQTQYRPWDSNRSSIEHVQAKTLQTAEIWGKADEHFIQFDLCRSLLFRAVLIPSNPMDSFILQSCYGNLLHSRSLLTLQCFYDDVIMYVNRGRSVLKSLKYLCLCAHHGLWCKMSCNAEDQLFQSLSYGQSVRNKWIRCWFRNRSVGLNSVRVRLIHSIKEHPVWLFNESFVYEDSMYILNWMKSLTKSYLVTVKKVFIYKALKPLLTDGLVHFLQIWKI